MAGAIHPREPPNRRAGSLACRRHGGAKSAVESVDTVVFVVKGRALGNEPLARSLARLKDPLYDAQDLVDELRYHRLRQQIEQGTQHDPDATDAHHGASRAGRSTENAYIPSSSGTQLVERTRGNATVSRLRAKEWKQFEITEKNQTGAPLKAKCKHCGTELGCPTNQGIGVLRNHLRSKACPYKEPQGNVTLSATDATTNPLSIAIGNTSSRKRMRPDQESTLVIAPNKNPWNKDDFSKRIRDITLKLQHVREGVVGVLNILKSDFASSTNHSQNATSHQGRRTSGVLQGRVHGRDFEKKTIIKLMTKRKSDAGVTVLPIVGIAGVGKTALAQLVYNDPEVKIQFYHTIWVWVSNNFDEVRLTKDMVDYVSKETHIGLCSFAKLQEILESHIKSKRVLLVLDDVWDGLNDCQWNQLLAPFNSDNAKGNMIIVTSRKPCVAKRRGAERPITLGAMDNNNFWLFFKACAFGDVNHEEQESLSDLGPQIAQKLKGNPLAAQTAGALLREHCTVDHWSSIMENEDWKSLTLSGGIMSALKLCYDQLPCHLQQCFSYCSLFPCSYKFLADDLVRIWISQGFVKCNNSCKRLDEIGWHHLTDLVNLGFFERVEEQSSSGYTQIFYVMHNLMHDFARVVSRTECATIDGWQCTRIFVTVRHLSIISSSIYHVEDQTGNIARSEKFEEKLRDTVASLGKLRSLVLIGQYDSFFFKSLQTAFQKAHNLRLLHFSSAFGDFHAFMCNLVNPTHLRHLKLEVGHAEQEALTQVLRKFFHLEVLDVNQYRDAWVASSQTVHQDNFGERRILLALESFRFLTVLKLSKMQSVREVLVPSLEELVLVEMPELKTCSCTSVGDLKSSLRVLEIQSCPALEVFDLFQTGRDYQTEHNSWFPRLRKLIICDCPNLHVLIPLRPSAPFSELLISGVSALKESFSQTLEIKLISVLGGSLHEIMALDDKFLVFHNMRDLRYLKIKNCWNLASILARTFGHLIPLRSFRTESCKEPFSSIPSNDDALPFLESLSIKSCGITGTWLSLMVRHALALKELSLDGCPELTHLRFEEEGDIQSNLMISAMEASSSEYRALANSAPGGLWHIPLNLISSLKKMTICGCRHLIFNGNREGLAGFTSLEELTIQECPKLLSSLVHNDGQANGRCFLPQSLGKLKIKHYPEETLRPCFVGNLMRLKNLEVYDSPWLKSIQLNSCTAMEKLVIESCEYLYKLEGMQSLGILKVLELHKNSSLESVQLQFCTSLDALEIYDCSSLVALEGMRSLVNLLHLTVAGSPSLDFLTTSGESCEQIKGISSDRYESFGLFPALEILWIYNLSPLATTFCNGLTCLRRLELSFLEGVTGLTNKQESALLLLGSLQVLQFVYCSDLEDLPAGLQSLPSLKKLKINDCECITRLPKEGLPSSLEKLVIKICCDELSIQCRSLVTSKLKVKIDGQYVN